MIFKTSICLALCLLLEQSPVLAEEQGVADETGQQVKQAGPVFNVWEFQVEGNTLVDRVQIERTVYRFLGPDRSIDDIDAAREALEVFYRDSGYPTVVVDIPEQDVTDGVVKLLVREGTIDRIRITGTRYHSPGNIRAQVPELAKGEVPHIPDVQQQLKELNQASPDRSVTPIFRPGRTPGSVEVELRVKDQLPIHGDFEINNRDSIDTESLRASASLRYTNLWQRNHSASLLYTTAPENRNDVEVISGTYVAPFSGGNVLAAYFVDSNSDVATAGTLAVIGTGSIFGARLVMPLKSTPDYFHSFTLGADYKDFDDNVLPIGSEAVGTSIKYLNWMAEYRGTALFDKSRTAFGVGTGFGLRGLVNSEKEFEDKRFQARPNYILLTSFLEQTFGTYKGSEVYIRLRGQVAGSPLVSNEQFSIGGIESVRGYYESQQLGDEGINLQLELRTPSLGRYLWEGVSNFRVHAFFDGAKTHIQDALPGQESYLKLYGAGFGMRLSDVHGFNASFDWAWALEDAKDIDSGDSRAHFIVHYGF